MQTLTPNPFKKYGITTLTLTANRDAKGEFRITFAPLRGWLLPADQDDINAILDRCIKDSLDQCSMTASAQGITSTGFDEAMPSYTELSKILMVAFEDLRAITRKMLVLLGDDEADRQSAHEIVRALVNCEIDTLNGAVEIVPIDRCMREQFMTLVISTFAGAPVEVIKDADDESFVQICGAPSHLPENVAKEIDEQIFMRLMTFVDQVRSLAIKRLEASRETPTTVPTAEAAADTGIDTTAGVDAPTALAGMP